MDCWPKKTCLERASCLIQLCLPIRADHDKTMPHYSVSNQYCNMKTGNWHETLHLGSEDCSTNWWNWWSPLDLTFTPDSCVAGMKLRKCSKGPCEKDDTIDLWHASAMGRW
jgi:hypothetical protein